KGAEERGQSESMARSLIEFASRKVPVIDIIIGKGGSGFALRLGVYNLILMLKNSTYSVISPEGTSALLCKDSNHEQIEEETMKITAEDLSELKNADQVLKETLGRAHHDIDTQPQSIKEALLQHLNELSPLYKQQIVDDRYDKFRNNGSFNE